MTDKERRKIAETILVYEAVVAVCRKRNIPVPVDVQEAVKLLRSQLMEAH